MSKYQLSCTIGTSDPTTKLGLEIWLDDFPIFNLDHVTETMPLKFEIEEDEADHELRFVMKNKSANDTVLDADGNIIKDATITISDVAFDDIKLGQVFIDRAVYTHDYNGSKSEVKDKFYGEMGCNGTVSLAYNTPTYIWLLEAL